MKQNSKFLLIGLLVLSILISISAINATDDNTSMNAIKTADNTQDLLNTQTNTIQKNNSIKSITKSENKNIKNENTNNKIKTQKIENNKINSDTVYKNSKKDYTVNNYEELYNTIDSIKHSSTNNEETVSLNEGTYTITNTITWDINKTLIINGNGKTIINGTQTNQFMIIGATSSVILNNIIIADCHAEKGGAIYDEGTLRINNVSFINNTVPANGGAIYTTAGSSLFIEKSTFDSNKQTEHVSGNSKGYNGGALSVRGTLYINDSTFINNLASYTNTETDSDGGNGGAIAFVTSTNDLTITNSRFDNNSARHGGAILIMNLNSDEGTRTIKNVTFTNNQGVYGTIVTYNTLTINNSTFKNNIMSGYGSGSNHASGGAILINSYNKTASPSLTVNNSIFDKNEAYEGGVIDIASVTRDCKNATVTINNSTFKNNNATNGGAIYLEYGDITIDNSIFDNNTGKLGGALYLKGHANINNSTFTKNNATSNGGAINVYNVNVLSANPYTLNIKNSIFTDNIASSNGGAIATQHIAVNNTTFTNNKAGAKGGAIHSANTVKTMPVNINNSKFTQNTAGTNGGAISLTSLTMITNTNFTDNKAMTGGAIHGTTSNLTITNSNFNNNKANSTTGGGAIYSSGNLNITNNNFTDNTATLKGGAIFITPNKNLTISDSKFDNNKAINETNYTYGGAIYTNARTNITNTEFTNNNASYGGAIYFTRNDTSNITNSKFTNNIAANRGGAIYNNASSTLDITNTIFDKNSHTNTTKANNNDYGGAAIFSEGGLHITSTNFTNNHANYTHGVANSDGGNGGAIVHYNSIKDLIIKNSNFNNNSARHGGSILIYNGDSDDGLKVIENTTFNGSVGVYGTIETYNSLNITSTVFANNTMEDYGSGNRLGSGGAIVLNSYFTAQSIKLSIDNSTFENNTATEGGVIRAGSPVPTTFAAPTLEITNSNFKNNHAYSTGGAISTYPADITITNTNFTNNKADNWGGAISTGISNLTITGSKFTNNSATKYGGAIYSVLDSTLKVNNATFTNNTQTQVEGANRNDYGGAAIFSNATLDINDTTFINNNANYTHNVSNSDGGNGGAIAFINSTNKLNINNSRFDANSARHGGSILIMNGNSDEGIKTITNTTFTNSRGVYGTIETYNSLNITDSLFDKNIMEDYGSGKRVGSGGAIVLNSMATNTKPVLTVVRTNFTNNQASLAGAIHIGGVSSTNGHPLLNVSNSTFKNNSVSSYGGAIYSQISDMIFENNYFVENKATMGGVIMSYTGSTLSSKNDTFENNKATSHGGVIYADNSEIQINSSKFINNNASLGGALLLGSNLSSSNIINSNFSNNNATYGGAILSYNNGQINNTEFNNNNASYGGALYVNSGSPTVGNSSFKQNTANVGGALYNAGTLTLDTNNFVNNNGANGETIYTTKALNTNDNTINLDDRTAFANQTTTISSPITDTSGSNNYVYEIYDPEGNLENTVNAVLIDNSIIVANYTFTNTGVYTVKLTYSGSVNNIEMKVTVGKSAITEITIDEIGLKHPQDSITISGVVNSESGIVAGETVIIYINGKQVATVVTDSESKYSYTATITTKTTVNDGFISLLPGRNNIDVSINEDSIYLKFTNSTDVIVSKLDTTIAIDNINNVIAGDSVTINGKLTDSEANIIANAKVTITVNGVTYTLTTDKDGKFSQVIPTTKAGNLNIITTYDGNERYDATHNTNMINITKRNTVLSINNTDTSLINDTFIVNGKLTTDDNNILDNAPILITINGMNYITHSDANGSFTLNVTAPNKTGNHTINAVYIGNDSFMSSTTNSQVNVKKLSTTTTVENITSKVNSNAVFTAKVVDEKGNAVLSGKVVFKLNNKTIGIVNIINGIASMEYKVINSPKDYEITAKYAESSAYTSSETIGVLHVIKRDANITLMNISESIVGDKINIVAIVAKDEGIANNGIVIFKINGVTLRNSDGGAVNSTVVNGIASISYTIPSSFSAKNYTITAVYSNNNYNRVESTVNLTIIKSNAITQLSPISTVHGENTTLNITLYDQKGRQIIRDNKLAVKINGKTNVHSVYTNGSANIVIPTESLKTGHYNLTIVFGANNAYNSLRLDTILFITMPVIDDSQNSTMKNETEIKAL